MQRDRYFGKGESCDDSCFVSFDTYHKALEYADLALSNLGKPRIELLPRTCAQHLGKLLDEIIGEIDFCIQMTDLAKRLLFISRELFSATKEEEGRLS